jgi:hypothetical protein
LLQDDSRLVALRTGGGNLSLHSPSRQWRRGIRLSPQKRHAGSHTDGNTRYPRLPHRYSPGRSHC